MLWILFDELGKVIGRVNTGNLPNAGTNDFEIFAVFNRLRVGNDGDYTGGSLSLYRPQYCGSPIEFPFHMPVEYKKFEGESSYFVDGQTYQGLYYNFNSYNPGDGSVILDTPGEWEAVITLFHVSNETIKNVVGVVDFNVGDGNYSEEETHVELNNIIEQIYAALSQKLNIVSNTYVKVVDSIENAILANYQTGDYILDRSTNVLYKKDGENHVSFVIDFDISTTDFVTINTEQTITGKKTFTGGIFDGNGRSLSQNDFTNAFKTKLEGIEANAQVNIIEEVQVNGTALTINNKSVNVLVPTKVSDLPNDAQYITKEIDNLTYYYTKTEMDDFLGEKQNVIDASHKLSADLVDDTNTTHKFFTAEERTKLANSYTSAQVDELLQAKQDLLYFDAVPTENSENPVISGGIYSAIEAVAELAGGRSSAFVISYADNPAFNSQNSDITVSSAIVTTSGDTIALNDLNLGDMFMVIELDVPDRWVSAINNGSITLSKMETAKVDLSTYYTKIETDNLLAAKVDKSTTLSSLYGVNNSGQQTVYLLDTNEALRTIPRRSDEYGNIIVPLTPANNENATSKKYVDDADATKVDKVPGMGLSHNDFTDSLLQKLEAIEAGAQVNVIESVKVNGNALTITNKAVDVPVPTKTSDITNDSGFITNQVNDLANYYTKTETDANFVDFDTTQTISGAKTFSTAPSLLAIKNTYEGTQDDFVVTYYLPTPSESNGANQADYIVTRDAQQNLYNKTLTNVVINHVQSDVVPLTNNANDLGDSDHAWKDLHLVGSMQDGTNTVYIADIADNSAARHTHANKALLDTYQQTEANLADAVAKKHSHANKALLDTYDQTNANIASAVSLKHSHDNKAILDDITAAYTTEEKTKLSGIASGAEVNVQSNWNEADDTSDAYIQNKPNLGTAAAKDYTSSVTSGSSDLVTSGAVYSAIDTAIENLPEAMVFKGTLGTGGTISSLPSASASNEGFTYKVITAGTYASQPAKDGDVFISNGTDWIYIPSADDVEDTWRGIKVNNDALLGNGISTGDLNFVNGTNVTITGNGNDITISSSYVDTNQKVKADNVTFGNDDTVEIIGGTNVTVGADASTKTITINSSYTDTNQKVKADNVTFGNDDIVNFVAGNNVTVSGDPSAKTITISSSYTDTNQKIKVGATTFSDDDVVDLVAGNNVTLTADTTGAGAPKITIASSYTDTNQTVKVSSTTFGSDAAVEFVGGNNVTITPDDANNTITIASSYTDTNQKVKVGSTTFENDATVAFVGGTNVTLVPDNSNNTITINSSYTDTNDNQTVKTSNTTFGINDAVEFVGGTNVSVVGDENAKTITISSTDTNDNQTVKVGDTTFGDNAVVTIVGGTNVTVTPDDTNNTITIASSYTDTNQKVKVGNVVFGNDDVVEFKGTNNITVTGNASNKDITLGVASGYSIPSSSDQTAWSAKYDKPSTGIPATDLEETYVVANTAITAATYPKIQYDTKGLVIGGSALAASDIPSLDASKITTGTFPDARIEHASTWNAKQDAIDVIDLR